MAIRLFIGPIPASIFVIAGTLLHLYPITEKKYKKRSLNRLPLWKQLKVELEQTACINNCRLSPGFYNVLLICAKVQKQIGLR